VLLTLHCIRPASSGPPHSTLPPPQHLECILRPYISPASLTHSFTHSFYSLCSHPNIVATYSFDIKSIGPAAGEAMRGDAQGLQILTEDRGGQGPAIQEWRLYLVRGVGGKGAGVLPVYCEACFKAGTVQACSLAVCTCFQVALCYLDPGFYGYCQKLTHGAAACFPLLPTCVAKDTV
jgi:hypothetical protein